MTDRERFEQFVTKTESCWQWTGAIGVGGYGRFSFKGKNRYAHRVAYFIYNGVLPDKLVLHSCDNRLCVNPSHFFLGTNQDNSDDMVSKGRGARKDGVYNGNSKITPEIVKAIRNSKGKLKIVAEGFGLKISHIHQIKTRKIWQNI